MLFEAGGAVFISWIQRYIWRKLDIIICCCCYYFPSSFSPQVFLLLLFLFGLVWFRPNGKFIARHLRHLFVTGFVKNTLTVTTLLVIPPSASLNRQCIHQAYWLSSLLTSPSLHCRWRDHSAVMWRGHSRWRCFRSVCSRKSPQTPERDWCLFVWKKWSLWWTNTWLLFFNECLVSQSVSSFANDIKTESTRKLSICNFQWTQTLYQNNLKNNCILVLHFSRA